MRNTYTLRIRNLTAEDRDFRVMLTSDEILRIDVETTGAVPNHVTVPANETLQARVYVIARPQDAAADAEITDLRLWVEDIETDDRAGVATIFNGKG